NASQSGAVISSRIAPPASERLNQSCCATTCDTPDMNGECPWRRIQAMLSLNTHASALWPSPPHGPAVGVATPRRLGEQEHERDRDGEDLVVHDLARAAPQCRQR